MQRHAFLVMAHTDFALLRVLLSLLDHADHDIYVHVDRASGDFPEEQLRAAVVHGTLTFTDRVVVNWGGYSQVAAELLLLERATEQPHAYYHLLSGMDLPLTGPTDVHRFFAGHAGREFVHIEAEPPATFPERVLRRHLFTERLRGSSARPVQVLKGRLDAAYVLAQRLLDRGPFVGSGLEPRKGSQWFSITDDLARHVLASRAWIESTYERSICGDESFLQTLVWHSDFRERLYLPPGDDHRACARMIDWGRTTPAEKKRGSPYVWRSADLAEILAAPQRGLFFARKFSTEVDTEVIEAVARHVRASAG